MKFEKIRAFNAIKKIIIILSLLAMAVSCTTQLQKKEPFCGDDICQADENQSCQADCGGFQGISKLECTQSKGSWNDCGSPCAGTSSEFCIQVCSPQCECGGIAGFKCPAGYKCRLTGKIPDEIGVCVRV